MFPPTTVNSVQGYNIDNHHDSTRPGVSSTETAVCSLSLIILYIHRQTRKHIDTIEKWKEDGI